MSRSRAEAAVVGLALLVLLASSVHGEPVQATSVQVDGSGTSNVAPIVWQVRPPLLPLLQARLEEAAASASPEAPAGTKSSRSSTTNCRRIVQEWAPSSRRTRSPPRPRAHARPQTALAPPPFSTSPCHMHTHNLPLTIDSSFPPGCERAAPLSASARASPCHLTPRCPLCPTPALRAGLRDPQVAHQARRLFQLPQRGHRRRPERPARRRGRHPHHVCLWRRGPLCRAAAAVHRPGEQGADAAAGRGQRVSLHHVPRRPHGALLSGRLRVGRRRHGPAGAWAR